MSKVVSARISDRFAERLAIRARQSGRKPSELAARYLKESLLMEEYPGIVFVDGPAGRRAHLFGTGLDVWEVAMLIEDGATVKQLKEEYLIKPGLLDSATRYASDYSDEVAVLLPLKDTK